jgi:hypothetical protein
MGSNLEANSFPWHRETSIRKHEMALRRAQTGLIGMTQHKGKEEKYKKCKKLKT